MYVFYFDFKSGLWHSDCMHETCKPLSVCMYHIHKSRTQGMHTVKSWESYEGVCIGMKIDLYPTTKNMDSSSRITTHFNREF
jgi:hypothetical protein